MLWILVLELRNLVIQARSTTQFPSNCYREPGTTTDKRQRLASSPTKFLDLNGELGELPRIQRIHHVTSTTGPFRRPTGARAKSTKQPGDGRAGALCRGILKTSQRRTSTLPAAAHCHSSPPLPTPGVFNCTTTPPIKMFSRASVRRQPLPSGCGHSPVAVSEMPSLLNPQSLQHEHKHKHN